MQVPAETKVTVDPDTVQTDVVVEVKETSPPEDAVALIAKAGSAADLSAKVANVIDCGATPLTEEGVNDSAVEPLPNCPTLPPRPPPPQHLTVRSTNTAQAYELLAATTAAFVTPAIEVGASTY